MIHFPHRHFALQAAFLIINSGGQVFVLAAIQDVDVDRFLSSVVSRRNIQVSQRRTITNFIGWCGNVDVQEICAGSTVYLPVFVDGALLCLGDCHAIQSDGEIGSVEMRSEVTLRCEVVCGRSPSMIWPRVETPDRLVTIGIATPLEEAARQALRK